MLGVNSRTDSFLNDIINGDLAHILKYFLSTAYSSTYLTLLNFALILFSQVSNQRPAINKGFISYGKVSSTPVPTVAIVYYRKHPYVCIHCVIWCRLLRRKDECAIMTTEKIIGCSLSSFEDLYIAGTKKRAV